MIAAVNGFCLGGGVGLVGNADCIVASDDAYFGVPEVDRGALGAATHLARLVPPHLMRTLYFTGRTITAADLVQHGSVLEVVPRDQLDDAALAVAAEIAAQGHPGDPGRQGGAQRHRPDRRQQELPVRAGLHDGAQPRRASRDELRDDFAGTDKAGTRRPAVSRPRDKRMTHRRGRRPSSRTG